MTLFWASPQAAGRFLVVAAHRHIRISIHPPREGWDVAELEEIKEKYNFNPPTP